MPRDSSRPGNGRIYCIEIDGVPVAAFPCAGDAEAQALTRQRWLAEDLASLSMDGRPLWRPEVHLAVRPASAAEIAVFEDGARHTVEDDGLVLVYLVAVDEPRSRER